MLTICTYYALETYAIVLGYMYLTIMLIEIFLRSLECASEI